MKDQASFFERKCVILIREKVTVGSIMNIAFLRVVSKKSLKNSKVNLFYVPLVFMQLTVSNQEFLCSLKIIDNIPSSLKLNAPIPVFPKTPRTGSFMADHILYQDPVLLFCS